MATQAIKVNYELDYEYFKMILAKRKLTIKKLSELIGVPDATLGHKLRKRNMQLSFVFAILNQLEIPFEDLFKSNYINNNNNP